jgi:hypothetical protein
MGAIGVTNGKTHDVVYLACNVPGTERIMLLMTSVHLVGSVALNSVDDVFNVVGQTIGPYIKRCPDGEVGGRRMWISWQWPLLRAARFLELAEDRALPGVGLSPLRLKADIGPADIQFGELGYAREARASFQDFLMAQERGALPRTARFQVSLPTPAAVIGAFIVAEDVARVLPAYEQAMLTEVGRLLANIPHDALAMQWDVCIEMLQWDGRLPHMAAPAKAAEIFSGRFARLCASIPAAVELGFHLCYGDIDGKHGIEPLDLGKAVELANLIVTSVGRPVQWVHMPVPIERDDDAYFAPLRCLKLESQTELFLGVVHASDGTAGTLRRMAVANRFFKGFGIATECGMGRVRSAETLLEILNIHAQAAKNFSA